MPTTAGVYIAALTAGTEVSSTYEGRHLTMVEDELMHPLHGDVFVNKGDPVVIARALGATPHTAYGLAVGVAFTDGATLADMIAIETEGVFNLNVNAFDDDGGVDVVPGDALFISDDSVGSNDDSHDGVGNCVISKIRNNLIQIPFGYALGYIAGGAYGVIAVKVHWDPRSHLLLDNEKLYFGDGSDVSIEWNGTFLAIAVAAESKAIGLDMAIADAALADGYGFMEVNANVAGPATAFVAADSTWINLAGDFVVMAGGGLITPHTDGIYQSGAAVITDATIALCGKFTDQLADSNFGMFNLWNLNLTQTLTALIEVNNPALLDYVVGTDVTNVVGSIPFYHTGGGAKRYIRLYSDAAA